MKNEKGKQLDPKDTAFAKFINSSIQELDEVKPLLLLPPPRSEHSSKLVEKEKEINELICNLIKIFELEDSECSKFLLANVIREIPLRKEYIQNSYLERLYIESYLLYQAIKDPQCIKSNRSKPIKIEIDLPELIKALWSAFMTGAAKQILIDRAYYENDDYDDEDDEAEEDD